MRIVRPSDSAAMRQMVENLANAEPTYSDIGATLTGRRPEGFHYDQYEAVLGTGQEAFEVAVRGLKTWQAHRLPGVRVFPDDERSVLGRPSL